MYILQLKTITPEYLTKIRIFLLYALKISDFKLVEQLFDILDEKYYRSKSTLFLTLF